MISSVGLGEKVRSAGAAMMAGLQKTRLNHVDCTVEVIAPASYPQPGNVDRFSDE